MSTAKTLAQAVPPTDPASQTLSLKDRIQNLPLPLQVLITCGFGLLMLIALADFALDPILLLDELLIGWLLYTGVSATAGTLKARREERTGVIGGGRLDVREQQAAEAEDGDPLKQAAEAELSGLGAAPGPAFEAKPAETAPPANAPRPAPKRIPLGDDTWKIFELLRKCRKLARSLERDGFPDAGKEQLQGIEKRVGELRQRFKELEQLLRTRELDLRHADREIKKLERRLESAHGHMERESVERSMAHAVHHREHILSVMEARNRYVLRLQELYHHVRQLHSSMLVMNCPAQVEADELIEEIDALVASVEAVEVVRREVQSTLAGKARAETVTVTEAETETETETADQVDVHMKTAADKELEALEESAPGGAAPPARTPADDREREEDRPDPRAALNKQRQG